GNDPWHLPGLGIIDLDHSGSDAIHCPYIWTNNPTMKHAFQPDILNERFTAGDLGQYIDAWYGFTEECVVGCGFVRCVAGNVLFKWLCCQFTIRQRGILLVCADHTVCDMQPVFFDPQLLCGSAYQDEPGFCCRLLKNRPSDLQRLAAGCIALVGGDA